MTQPRPLTACQVEVLRLAAAHIAEHGVSPTRSELARAYGCRDTTWPACASTEGNYEVKR